MASITRRSPDIPGTDVRSIVPEVLAAGRKSKASSGGGFEPKQRLYGQGIFAVLADPSFKARLADLGILPTTMTPTDFGKLIADETEKWGKVIRAANIKVNSGPPTPP
jgi:hypothetical protein